MARTTIGAPEIRAKYTGLIKVITYAASMTPDLSLGDIQVITASNTTAFTINAPTNPTSGQRWNLRIANASGGTLGTITWNAVFKQGTIVAPLNGKSIVLGFYWDGTNHWKLSEADAL